MAINVGNPQDHTGREKARLEALAANEKKETAKRLSMATEKATSVKEGVIDLTDGSDTDETPTADGGAVSVTRRTKKMRVNVMLENVTIGHGTDYTFEPGQQYKVDEGVYNYLDEKGFVWH